MKLRKTGNTYELEFEPVLSSQDPTGFHEAAILDFGIYTVSEALRSKSHIPSARLVEIVSKLDAFQIAALSKKLEDAQAAPHDPGIKLNSPKVALTSHALNLCSAGLILITSRLREGLLGSARLKSPLNQCEAWAISAENTLALNLLSVISNQFPSLPNPEELLTYRPWGFSRELLASTNPE